ncbi:MAG: response regulator [Rhodocyclaceae bacterium]|nr:response regulator [Rhodocyclaceae bacterium]MDZ4213465.1 response regulator [Rhodocyclaceae bacterium]
MNTPEEKTAAPVPRVLCVDDEPSILSALKRVFRPHGFTVFTATSGQEGLALLENEPIDVVISDMRMPEMNGAQFLEQVFAKWPATKRILLTGYADAAATISAINQGKIWRYVAKPWNDSELVMTVEQALAHRNLMEENARLTQLTLSQNEELKGLNASLEEKVAKRTAELAKALKSLETAHTQLRGSFLATVQLFSGLVELRGGRLAGHSRRVADLSRRLVEHLGIADADQQDVFLAALLHDVGKLGLPDNLLNAPFNALTPQGKTEVMHHPVKGQQLLMSVEQLANAAKIIRHHHECLDGSGYPDGLVGLQIPLGARILSVCNDYDALQAGALTLHTHTSLEAQQYLQKERGRRYDPEVIDAFFAMLKEEAAKRPLELQLAPAQLKPGMVLTRDLTHADGYTLLPAGRVLNADVIGKLVALEQTEKRKLLLHIRNDVSSSVLRDKQPEPPPRTWKEVVMSSERLKPGMVLTRNINHKEGYLLLARGSMLDEGVIKQLREFERINGEPMTVYIRMESR